MKRIPLLTGSRIALAEAPEDAVILRPPAPGEAVADVEAAVRDALRFPLAGEPLEALASPGARATIVVEPPALPIPGSARDPRQAAVAATVDELERIGVRDQDQTLLVAGGLARRAGREERKLLVSPEFARRFRGSVEVHDAASESLVEVGSQSDRPVRVHPALTQTDLIVSVSAAESVLHGGPAALLGAADPGTIRAAGAESLLETGASAGWESALALERALSARVPVMGVSLALGHPRLGGSLSGWPYDPASVERIASSPLRSLFSALPAPLRAHVLRSLRCELGVTGAFGGPPSAAHAEALLRGIEARSTMLDGRLDAIVIGIPHTTPHLPRERPNPLLAASLGLGLALRLWRDEFPLVDGGTVILVHGFERHFSHPTQQPYRAFFGSGRMGWQPERLAAAEAAAASDDRALTAYREGRACHPLLPFADWAGCGPALRRAGDVLVAGCRDAVAARQLGFVATRGLRAALHMVEGRVGPNARVGYLLSPPYFPLRVSQTEGGMSDT